MLLHLLVVLGLVVLIGCMGVMWVVVWDGYLGI